ncbi:MAG: hypothetical protein PWP48_771 [Clostridiales bacterium]|jgi:hypothetical protein|nr:hypothetical protein [Clostridiales bacterium]
MSLNTNMYKYVAQRISNIYIIKFQDIKRYIKIMEVFGSIEGKIMA